VNKSSLQLQSNMPIQDYRALRFLGNGTYGSVSEVFKPHSNERMAAKIIKKKFATDKESKDLRQCVTNEIKAYETLKSKVSGVIELYENFEDDGHWYLILEYIDGPDLLTIVSEKLVGTTYMGLDMSLVRAVFHSICRTVSQIHQVGVAHLDIKLENIMLTSFGAAKLIDFGLCEFIDPARRLITRWVGSPDYVCPEIILAQPYDPFKADVFSLGVVLYALLVGQFPFAKDERVKKLVREGTHPNVHWPLRTLPVSAIDLVNRMLHSDPAMRPTMEEVLKHPWFKEGR